MKRFFLAFIKKIASYEPNPKKITQSFCLGNYIAFSPFLGFHTLMAVVFARLFKLNMAVTLATTYAINNPWTAIPIYASGYFFGYWLLHGILGADLTNVTPHWALTASSYLEYKLGISHLCFWSFMIGGNILGSIISILLYPIVKRLFTSLNKVGQ